MDYSTIITAISSVGFPIIACIMVYKAMLDNNKDFNAQVREMMKIHSDEIKTLQASLDNNTTALERMIDRLDDLEAESRAARSDDGK